MDRVGRIVRLNIVSGAYPKAYDSYVMISVGSAKAKSNEVKNSSDPFYDEHFVIDYNPNDTQAVEYLVQAFDKGLIKDDLIGLYRGQLIELEDADEDHKGKKDIKKKDEKKTEKKDEKKEEKKDEKKEGKKKEEKKEEKKKEEPKKEEPKKEEKKDKKEEQKKKKELGLSWHARTPATIILKNDKDKETGKLYIRMRREFKVYGKLHLEVKEVTLKSGNDDEAHLISKLGTQSHKSEPEKGKKGKFSFKKQIVNFDVTDSNNTHDVFIEVWQKGAVVGELRINLFDVKKNNKPNNELMAAKKEGSKLREVVGNVNYDAKFEKEKK